MLLGSRFIERCASSAWERVEPKASSLPLRMERPSRRLMLLQRMDRDLQYERISRLNGALTFWQVREQAGISFNHPFSGEPYHFPHQDTMEKNAHYLTLADLLLEGPYPSSFLRDHATMTIHRSGTALLIPLPLPDDIEPSNPKHLSFWRIVFDATIMHEIPPAQPDLAYIQESFNKRRDIWELPKVAEIRVASRYRVREAMASTAYKPFGNGGHILLVGDAAHVHSPAGGQGTF